MQPNGTAEGCGEQLEYSRHSRGLSSALLSDPKWPSSWGGQSGVPMYLLKKRAPAGYAPLHVAK